MASKLKVAGASRDLGQFVERARVFAVGEAREDILLDLYFGHGVVEAEQLVNDVVAAPTTHQLDGVRARAKILAARRHLAEYLDGARVLVTCERVYGRVGRAFVLVGRTHGYLAEHVERALVVGVA